MSLGSFLGICFGEAGSVLSPRLTDDGCAPGSELAHPATLSGAVKAQRFCQARADQLLLPSSIPHPFHKALPLSCCFSTQSVTGSLPGTEAMPRWSWFKWPSKLPSRFHQDMGHVLLENLTPPWELRCHMNKSGEMPAGPQMVQTRLEG